MQNYHSHKTYTNSIIADCPVLYSQYIDRALELRQRVITSVEHGYQGNYFELNELIRKKNIELQERRDKGEKDVPEDLMFIFGAEAYWVKDRHEHDKSNCHMIILAKNENGRKAINLMLSIANEDGMFNGRPRIDFELLFQLPKDDVFITSACIAYWNKYNDIDEITKKFHDYFGDNFYLEVQNHNTTSQKQLNKHILELSKKYDIDIIAGLDSHCISDRDNIKRTKLLEYKNIHYEDEEGWYVDYPSEEEAIRRFKEQGILSDEEIKRAINNTDLLLKFDDLNLGLETRIDENGKRYLYSEIKLPTIDPDKTQNEKDVKLINIIKKEWDKYKIKENIPKEEYIKYNEAIQYELGEIIKTKMSDYFLIHYKAIKDGIKKYNGQITKRGRGSAVSYFVNTLLGFSKVDRLKTPIKLYPERFITADRILKSRSCPDIDNNVSTQEPFVKAFRDLLGYNGVYPFVSYGTLKKSSAIRMYMGAEGIEASIQDKVSEQLKKYDEKLKHCETDEEKEEINIEDYISEEYKHYVEDSKDFQGIVTDKKPHPCGFMLLNGDIRKEIGLITCVSKTKKTKTLCACIDGTTAEHYKYLKSDLLIVDVVGLTEDIWERIGEESISNSELERRVNSEEGKKTWDIYAKGYTCCVNQCEKENTTKRVMKYAPKNTGEISAFVAGVRPGFKSLFNNFIERKPYSTGVKALDEVLKDSYHYMLYQESIMAFLGWLGIDMKETYDIVKKISKKIFLKNPKLMEELKEECKELWLNINGNLDGFDKAFQVMNDAGSYAFNASHSYCVGNDGVELAYLKAYYPYEFYECALNRYDKKKNKDKVARLKQEMKEAFNIDVGELKFGLDNTKFTYDKENHCINPTLSAIKGMGKNVAEELYNLSKSKKYNNFIELLIDIKNTSLDKSMLEILIKIDYFSEFGKSKYLLELVKLYDSIYDKKVFSKDKLPCDIEIFKKYANKETAKQFREVDIEGLLNELILKIPNEDISIKDRLETELDKLGLITYTDKTYNDKVMVVTEVKTNSYGTPFLTLYQINSGKSTTLKTDKRYFNKKPVKQYDMLILGDIELKDKKKKTEDGKFVSTGEKQYILKSYGRVVDEVEEINER